MSEPNIPLLRKYVEWVEEQEQRTEGREWYQESWYAHEDELMGNLEVYERLYRHSRHADDLRHVTRYAAYKGCGTAFCLAGRVAFDHGWIPLEDGTYLAKDGVERPAEEIATEILGLGTPHHLFDSNNTAERIRYLAEKIAGEPL